MTAPGDYYTILGITRDATARQVKAAYRKLAKKHHPDACPGDPDAASSPHAQPGGRSLRPRLVRPLAVSGTP
jgi:curved DNA-binding protein CbpA